MPYPITEVVGFIEDWLQYDIYKFMFESLVIIRPGFALAQNAIFNVSSDMDVVLAAGKIVHILSVLTVMLFVWLIARPRTANDCIAFVTAVACLVGVASFRENLENYPLNHTMLIMAMSAYALWAVLQRYRLSNDVSAILISLFAVSVKEQGLAVPVLYITARIIGLRGTSRAAALIIAILLAVYVAARIFLAGNLPTFYRDAGFLFEFLSHSQLEDRFGDFPLLLYLYNMVATALNTLLSEPTNGTFMILRDIAAGRPQPWQLINLVSSLLATAAICWWGIRSLLSARSPDSGQDWRIFMLFIVAGLGVGSVLGYNYTRDRFGGVPGVLFAVCLFFALRMLLDTSLQTVRTGRVAILALALLAFGALWQLRAVGTVQFVRELAWQGREEWILQYPRILEEKAERPDYLRGMALLYEQGTDTTVPSTDMDPHLLRRYIGERGAN